MTIEFPSAVIVQEQRFGAMLEIRSPNAARFGGHARSREATMRLFAPNTLLALMLAMFAVKPASAGLFDDMLNKAKQAAQDAYDDAVNGDDGGNTTGTSQQPAPPPAPASAQTYTPLKKPAYDPVLVRQIQERLNVLGYSAGKPDGLYGPGTREAIKSFQAQRGIAADGLPSQSLLTALQTTEPSKSNPASATTPAKSVGSGVHSAGTLPTSSRNIARALLSLAPEKFPQRPDKELKQLVVAFYPEERQKVLGDEFYWQKNKAGFIQKMLAESKGAPRTFEVAPWINNAPTAGDLPGKYRVDLIAGRYDFQRQAFPIHMQGGSKSIRLPWIHGVNYKLVGTLTQPKKYWLEIPPDKAEALNEQLVGGQSLDGRFRFTIVDVVGFDPEKHPDFAKVEKYYKKGGKAKAAALDNLTPVALVKIEDNKVEVYAAKKPGPVKTQDDLRYLTSLDISAEAQVAGAGKKKAANKKAAAAGATLTGFATADILGIKLGMPMDEATGIIKAHRSDFVEQGSPEKVNKARPWDPYTNFIHFVAPENRELIGLYTEPPAAGNRVTQVSRSLFIPPDQSRPKYDAVIKSLTDKYGVPIYRLECEDCENHSSTFVWLNWGGQGELPKKTASACRKPSTQDKAYGYNRLMQHPRITDPQCPEKIIARVGYQGGTNVYSIQVFLTNTAQIAEYVAENERREKAAREQAKGAPVPAL
jgi:peptidoglycan hydrolase-like protein with peptidoglycan-binding domain